MERFDLSKELLENAIGDYLIRTKFESPFDMIVVQAMEELLAYKTTEEQGLLLRLPCPIGSTIYVVVGGEIEIHEATSLHFFIEYEEKKPRFGKTWFLTKEEAERASAEMQEG